ncbi:MAG TPA: glycosyltransferase family 2 protein, partial [Chromatiales bacterium]|nr:glycosyltransferase family 2 protein [Chromatiales bacterium]
MMPVGDRHRLLAPRQGLVGSGQDQRLSVLPDHAPIMPSQRPAISILLPFRDAGPWLDECLDSIQAQSFRDFELLAVDDHSRDGSAARVRRRRDGRFRLLRP